MHLKNIPLFILLTATFFCASARNSEGSEKASGEAQLRARVTEFWTAWARNDQLKLISMVHKQDRQAFAAVPRFELFDFKIDSIEMAPDLKSATVTTKVKRQFPMRTTPMEWVLENVWGFERGNWYLYYQQSPPSATPGGQRGLFNQESSSPGRNKAGPSPTVPPTTPGPVAFDSISHDFGSVAAGTPLHYEYTFENRGIAPVRVTRVVGSCLIQKAPGRCLKAYSNRTRLAPGDKAIVVADFENSKTDKADAAGPEKVDETIEVDFDNGQAVLLHFVVTITAVGSSDH
jgi:hypothetical protein